MIYRQQINQQSNRLTNAMDFDFRCLWTSCGFAVVIAIVGQRTHAALIASLCFLTIDL